MTHQERDIAYLLLAAISTLATVVGIAFIITVQFRIAARQQADWLSTPPVTEELQIISAISSKEI